MNLYIFLRHFYLLDPDPDPGGLFKCGYMRIRIRNTGVQCDTAAASEVFFYGSRVSVPRIIFI